MFSAQPYTITVQCTTYSCKGIQITFNSNNQYFDIIFKMYIWCYIGRLIIAGKLRNRHGSLFHSFFLNYQYGILFHWDAVQRYGFAINDNTQWFAREHIWTNINIIIIINCYYCNYYMMIVFFSKLSIWPVITSALLPGV